jgi:alpha-tubulin suppressor-like RCC1 family protein
VASVSTKATGPIVAIDAGNDHTCVLTAKGKLFCWGSNANGQLGLPPGTPQFSAAAIAVPLP